MADPFEKLGTEIGLFVLRFPEPKRSQMMRAVEERNVTISQRGDVMIFDILGEVLEVKTDMRSLMTYRRTKSATRKKRRRRKR